MHDIVKKITKYCAKSQKYQYMIDKKVNNTYMIKEFFRETDPSQYEEIVKKIMCLTPENIEQIFTKIEKNGITIPIEVKNVVKATLAEGVKEVKEALNKGVSL